MHFMCLLLLNINYLRHHFLSNIMQKKIMDFDTLPNGVRLARENLDKSIKTTQKYYRF